MDHEKPTGPFRTPSSSGSEELAQNPAVDDLFRRLKQDLHQPKPGNEAIAAALQAVQRLTSQVDADASASAMAESVETRVCLSCGSRNPVDNRFCAICGVPQQDAPPFEPEAATVASPRPAAPAAGQHHYHHHYHHHYFASSEGGIALPGAEPRPVSSVPAARDLRARTQLGGASLSRAEAAVRKLTQEWALACNSKQLDDLVGLYAVDAIVLRPNVPPVRGSAAIREFFFGLLDAGFGDVETDPLRTEVFGDGAYEAGRCKMLVPSTTGKRREERGKYLFTLARQAGEWKILADCWTNDLSLGGQVDAVVAKSSPPTSGAPVQKPPHKI